MLLAPIQVTGVRKAEELEQSVRALLVGLGLAGEEGFCEGEGRC